MLYETMIKTENSDIRNFAWKNYRDELTDYIIESVLHTETKKYLMQHNKKRLSSEFSIEQISRQYEEENGSKPTLAIWGAGGCNDIDIKILSRYFKLALIDQDMEAMLHARNRESLSEEQCSCLDIKFWDIEVESYKMFEALLLDGAPVCEIIEFLDETFLKLHLPEYNISKCFDYSVGIGIASQLNVRFVALLHLICECNKDFSYTPDEVIQIEKTIENYNYKAVNAYVDAVKHLTRHSFICGYEILSGNVKDTTLIDKLYNSVADEELDDNVLVPASTISGNKELESCLRSFLSLNSKFLRWNFSDDKEYLMVISNYFL